MAVTVDWEGLDAAWRAAEWEEFLWEFVGGPPSEVLAVVNEVIEEVDDIFDPEEGPYGPSSELSIPTIRGTVALMMPVGTVEEVRGWYDDFARRLTARGLSGTVEAARQPALPEWLRASDGARQRPTLTALLALELPADTDTTPGAEDARWGLSADTTGRLLDGIVPWLDTLDEPAYLAREMFDEPVPEEIDLRAELLWSLPHVLFTTALRAAPETPRLRSAAFATRGQITLQLVDSGLPCEDNLEAIADVVRSVGRAVDVGSIRYSRPLTRGWRSADYLAPHSPHWNPTTRSSEAVGMDQRPWIRKRWVVDAYGIQVLSGEVLARVRDLSDWLVEPLGRERHLVSHRDLGAWYATPTPDPDVLARARSDFADIILTPETRR